MAGRLIYANSGAHRLYTSLSDTLSGASEAVQLHVSTWQWWADRIVLGGFLGLCALFTLGVILLKYREEVEAEILSREVPADMTIHEKTWRTGR